MASYWIGQNKILFQAKCLMKNSEILKNFSRKLRNIERRSEDTQVLTMKVSRQTIVGIRTKLQVENLRQDIQELKETIKVETAKVESLNEVIETLQNKTIYKEIKAKSNERRGRYWNREFSKKGDECRFYHPKEDCGIIFTSGNCEDKKCQKRHRKYCRYVSTKVGCFRKDTCQCRRELSRIQEIEERRTHKT